MVFWIVSPRLLKGIIKKDSTPSAGNKLFVSYDLISNRFNWQRKYNGLLSLVYGHEKSEGTSGQPPILECPIIISSSGLWFAIIRMEFFAKDNNSSTLCSKPKSINLFLSFSTSLIFLLLPKIIFIHI